MNPLPQSHRSQEFTVQRHALAGVTREGLGRLARRVDMYPSMNTMTTKTRKISSTIPAATLAQRIASMSTAQLMDAARALAPKRDAASDTACTAILDALETSTGNSDAFQAFVAEIYGQEIA